MLLLRRLISPLEKVYDAVMGRLRFFRRSSAASLRVLLRLYSVKIFTEEYLILVGKLES
jgi:hypothetical protein